VFKKQKSLAPHCIKLTRPFVESILKHIFPWLQDAIQADLNKVTLILQSFQQATRFVNSICSQIKSEKQNAIVSKIPPLKKVLETFIIKVQQLYSSGGFQEAFWIGTLKHRNMDGDIMCSQYVAQETNEETVQKSTKKRVLVAPSEISLSKKSVTGELNEQDEENDEENEKENEENVNDDVMDI
ncbi:hypothetical protein ROZALSC1DRAFT_25049, partial [Rozella allomycis CSF55]